jgi:6-phosphogluconolactonase/glucosamine-6-phosphate isomerase/deaminase
MKVLIGLNKAFVDQMAQTWMHKEFHQGIRDFFIPAGGTPEGLYQLWRHEKPEWINETYLYQVDDIIDGEQKDKFYNFFQKHLGEYRTRLQRIGETSAPETFSTILGLGLNGHVAFHEPNLPEDFSYGKVELTDVTKNYLKLKESQTGITYGLGTFMKSKSILLIVKGEHKLDILTRFLKDDPSCPAIALKKHQNLTLVIDEELWKLVDEDLKKNIQPPRRNSHINFFV